MCHPAVPNARHAAWYRLDGRNRVLLARRNLPWPLAWVYLLDWLALTVLRERSRRRAGLAGRVRRGLADGPAGTASDIAGTAWRMTRARRPPVI